jgi:hypothetical protein
MSYVTPILNRSAADLLAKNNNAYFNVSDWTRIYGNALYVNGHILSVIGFAVPFITASTPTTSSIPAVSDFNNLLANIEAMRAVVAMEAGVFIQPVTTQVWSAGAGNPAPSYLDVNQWESVIDQIHTLLISTHWMFIRSGLAKCGAPIVQNHRWRS